VNCEEGFLEAIRQQPDDDGVRLVYADWVEEQGSRECAARAEFIRVQVRLANTPEDDPHYPELAAREEALRSARQKEWLGEAASWLTEAEFRSGMLEGVTLPAWQFLERAEELFALGPVRRARLFGTGGGVLAALAASPHLARIQSLDLAGNDLRAEDCRTLAESPHLAGLEALHLGSNHFGAEGARALAASPHLGRLRLLGLANTGIGASGVEALADSPTLDGVEVFLLDHNRLGGVSLEALAAGRHLRNLRRLSVGHSEVSAAGLRALAFAPRFAGLEELRAGHNPLGNEGVAALAGSPYLTHLTNLRLPAARLGTGGSAGHGRSWGMFHPSWDFPVGSPQNYSDNPNHPFNIIVSSLEAAGADILFAAGNCGPECPDGRCRGATDKGIYGANTSPAVTCVAGVLRSRDRVGYSTKGPGRLEDKKPDIASFTHFAGSGVYPADGGTSAATPVAAGVVAALRRLYPSSVLPPADLRDLLGNTAEQHGQEKFNYEYGYGVIDVRKLLEALDQRFGGGPATSTTAKPKAKRRSRKKK
jgi:uncharacterized protein (TIGR02996 family)